MQNVVIGIYRFFNRNRFVCYSILCGLIIFSIIGISRIKLEENINSILPADGKISQMTQLLNNTKFADQLIFTIATTDSTGADVDSMQMLANRLTELLRADSLVKDVRLQIDNSAIAGVYDFFYNNIHLYLSDDDYDRIAQKLTPEKVEETVKSCYKTLISPTGIAARKYMLNDPLALTPIALEKLKYFQLDDNYEIINNYIFTKDKLNLLFFVEPKYGSSEIKKNTILMSNIHSIVDTISVNYPELKVYYYGGTAVSVANADRVKTDIIITVLLAFVFLGFLFFCVFRQIKIIALLFFPILLGAGVALAIMTFIEPSLSSIALSVGAALIGMSVDYSLHLFTHYKSSHNMESTLSDIAEPIAMSCLTTVSAFLCLYILKSDALRELGLFVSITIICVSSFVLSLIPVLLNKIDTSKMHSETKIFDRIVSYPYHRNKYLVAIVIALSVVFMFTSQRLSFNSNIAAVNYMPDELRESEAQLQNISSETYRSIYAVMVGDNLDEALRNAESKRAFFDSCRAEGYFTTMSMTTDLMMSDEFQLKQIERWNSFWKSQSVDSIRQWFIESGKHYNFKEKAFSKFIDNISQPKMLTSTADFEFLRKMFLDNFILESDSTVAVVAILRVDQNKCAELVSQIESRQPDIIVVDKGGMVSKIFDSLKVNFEALASASMVMIFIILLVFFGRIELAVITFIPISLSWIWTIGMMGMFGIEFNIFNIIVSTFIFGLGIDYSIFITRGLMNNYKYGNRSLKPYKMSILMSSLTTIGAMGVLLVAQHLALRSIALVSVIGITSVLLISNILLPVLFDLLVKRADGVYRERPITCYDLFVSIYSLIGFLIGIIFLIVLIPILSILPLPRRNVRSIYHHILCFISKIVVRINVFSSVKIIDKSKADFSRPSVIICNHQSHIDLVLMLMQNPKIVVLTNEWVWRSPILRFVVRFAGFCPIYQGLETHLPEIKKRIGEGYSVLVFPEGTRTTDGSINRFHRGAFDIAAQLGLPIQPIVIHGAHQCLPKKEFFMRASRIVIKYFDTLNIDSNRATEELYSHELAKNITKFYRQQYATMCQQFETPDFYYRTLTHKYIFKNPVLEWYMKVKVRMEDKYRYFDNIIPRNAKITDIGCGYGFLANMLRMTSRERNVLGCDYDSQKIEVARQTIGEAKNIRFEVKDIINEDVESSDVFILNDILHYMPENDQMQVLEKCFSHLNKGGMMIVRDANADMQQRTKVTRLTEFFSTRLLKFNKTQFAELSFISGQKIIDIAKQHGLQTQVVDNAHYTSNLTYIIRRNE